MKLYLMLGLLVGCGGAPASATQPQRSTAAAPAQAAEPPPCPPGTVTVKRCVTEGMPVETPDGDFEASVTCQQTCDRQPPTEPGCAQDSSGRYNCSSAAP